MTNPRDIFIQETEPKFDRKQDKPAKFRAVITNNLGQTDTGSPWHDENARLVWVRAWGSASPEWVLCDAIEPDLGLGVWVKFNDDIGLYEVERDDPLQRSPDSNRLSYRAPTNEDFLKGGRFQLWLDPTLFIPISVYPTGADTVNVVIGDYIYQGERKTFAGEVNLDLSASRPAVGLHRLVGIYLDSANTINTVDGSTIATGTDAPEPTWPAGAFRVAIVDLDNSTDISIEDIDNRKVIYTEDEGLLSGAWPPPGKVYRWDISAGLVIIEDDLPTAVSNASSDDVIALGAGTYTLTNQLSITTNLSIIGPQSDDHQIANIVKIDGDVTGGLISVSNNATASLVNLFIENIATTGAGHGIVLDNADLYVTNCQLYAESGDDVADCIYADSTNGSTRIYVFGGYFENSPSTTGYAVNLAVHSSILIAYIYHPAYLNGDTADINAVANTEVYLFGPSLENNSLNGAGTFYGEFRSNTGVTYYVGDTAPAADQFPKWDNVNSRWTPGYVDELWESDGGAVAWETDADGNLLSENSDIFPGGDEAGLMARQSGFNLTYIEDDFSGSALDVAWSWAGAPFNGTPNRVDLNTNSILFLGDNTSTRRFFLYRTDNLTDKYHLIRHTQNVYQSGAYCGWRFDDGTDNNYTEGAIRYNGTDMELISVYRTGGGARTLTVHQTIYDWPKFASAGIQTGGTLWSNWQSSVILNFDTGRAVSLFIMTTGLTWTPTRRGIIFENSATTADFKGPFIDRVLRYN